MLDKNLTLFERDDKGTIIEQKVSLDRIKDKDGNSPEIVIKPINRGKLRRITAESVNGDTTKDQDAEAIAEHCINPKYTLEELEIMKPTYFNAIRVALYAVSLDVTQKQMEKQLALKPVESVVEDNDFLSK